MRGYDYHASAIEDRLRSFGQPFKWQMAKWDDFMVTGREFPPSRFEVRAETEDGRYRWGCSFSLEIMPFSPAVEALAQDVYVDAQGKHIVA